MVSHDIRHDEDPNLLQVTPIEQVKNTLLGSGYYVEESFWIFQLDSLYPKGLN